MSAKKIALTVALVCWSALAMAGNITITGPSPSNSLPTGAPNPSCTGGNGGTDTAFLGSAACGSLTPLSFLYKHNIGGGEEGNVGLFSFSAVTANAGGGDDLLLTWTGGAANACAGYASCWLVVKDGNANPGRYGYNLSTQTSWNGNGNIQLLNFWPAQGSISHVALFGVGTCTSNCFNETPEPSTVALVGLALLGAGAARRRAVA